MKLNMLKSIIGIVLTSSLITSVHAEVKVASEQDWKKFNNATVNQFIIPAYTNLASAAKILHQNTESLCEAPSESKLKQSRTSFHQTMDAWQSIQNVTFGPIEYSLRSYSIQFWPDKKNHIGKHLGKLLVSNDPSLLKSEQFQRSSVSIKGLPAIERILFSQSSMDEIKSDKFRCQVLITISQNVEAISTSLSTEWQTDMRKQFADAKQVDGYFEDDIDAATAILKTMIEPLEVIRDLKLKRPLASAFGKQKFKRLESWRSERSLRNIEKNLQTLQQMFAGTDNQSGLSQLLPKNIFDEIKQQYEAILFTIKQFDSPLEHAIRTESGYQATVKIYEDMGILHKLLEKTASELGIHLGFNSRDGD